MNPWELTLKNQQFLWKRDEYFKNISIQFPQEKLKHKKERRKAQKENRKESSDPKNKDEVTKTPRLYNQPELYNQTV